MTKAVRVWVVDDDQSIRWVMEKAMQSADISVRSFTQAGTVLPALAMDEPDVMVVDIRMPGMDGLSLLKKVHERSPDLPVIIMTAHSDLDSAVSAYQGGAFEYLPKPFDVDDAVALVLRASETHREHVAASKPGPTPEIIGEAPAMQEVFRAIGRLSRSHITVTITGGSGTGKELVARALHRHSPRADGPFIALNTAAIPRDLLESELFGHERGAFTGAQASRVGRFEQANGGTLFLDEIGDMPAELQTRLLRVLAEGEFYRVGAHTPTKVNTRVIAATHQNLENRVKEGAFREDLFHRLNVIRVQLPSLRDRREDIPLLLNHFLGVAAKELEVECKTLHPDATQYLTELDWPGNVRQLENICRWLTVMASGREVLTEDLPADLHNNEEESSPLNPDWQSSLKQWAGRSLANGDTSILNQAIPDFERIMINAALEKTAGHRQEAARLLGWGRNTLTRKIKELGI